MVFFNCIDLAVLFPEHLNILLDSVLWRKVYKEQLSNLDLSCGRLKLLPLPAHHWLL